MNTNDSVIVFGLDGATYKILDPLIDKGEVPTIASLAKGGAKLTLKSTVPPLTGAAWVTFQTGADPGRHGITEFFKRDGSLISGKDVHLPRLWQIIAKTGHTSCIINMPVTYPVGPVNGILVSSFLTPPGAPFAYPKKIEKELKKKKYQIDLDSPFKIEERQIDKTKMVAQIKDLVHSHGQAGLSLVTRKPWSLFFVLFKATDWIQHIDYDGLETGKIYALIDSYILKILAAFKHKYPNRRLHVLILSDHGFHRKAERDIALYPLLRSLSILSSIPWPILKLARGVRRLFRKKPRPAKVTSYGMYEKDKKKQHQIVKKLRTARYGNKKIFQFVTTAQKLYGAKYHPGIPDIIWLVSASFAPNPDPLSDRLVYINSSPLIGTHLADRYGIFIINSPRIRDAANFHTISMPQVTTLICELLGVPYPEYFIFQPFPLS